MEGGEKGLALELELVLEPDLESGLGLESVLDQVYPGLHPVQGQNRQALHFLVNLAWNVLSYVSPYEGAHQHVQASSYMLQVSIHKS